MHKTLQGTDLTVTGFGNNLRVNNASVVCGGVQTANATVYLIDTVLYPAGHVGLAGSPFRWDGDPALPAQSS